MSEESRGEWAPHGDIDAHNKLARDYLPGHMGVVFTGLEHGRAEARLEIRHHHLAPNGFLHAATPLSLADTAAGFGCRHSLPEGANGFTTIDLSCNYLGTATEGAILCVAEMVHGGRSTQVWDVKVRRESDDKVIALFRCTQMVLYPRN
ncbi:MAG TPA: PaaI family thioesterase [Candidatus Dormibacteraeota bacterium]|nr:PaaI family thioesterase [Candidatus Dormibacteraeota bacterium]